MLIDANIGGSIDGTAGGAFKDLHAQLAGVDRHGYDGVWTTEVGRDPFFPLLLAAEHSDRISVGTAISVAFARSPMTLAATAHDLQSFSEGRFILGLGSQVKAHIERRFSMPWSEPAKRMADFIGALRAIWSAWNTGERLTYEGAFYQHTLMTPMFSPPPNPWGPPPIYLAAVGQAMTKVAATRADGLIVHGFTTEQYLREVTLRQVEAGLRESGRARTDFAISYPAMVVTGSNDEEFERAALAVRKQLAFYGATPAYRSVLDLHGLGDLHVELHRLSTEHKWDEMTSLFDDSVLELFAVQGSPEDAAIGVVDRFAGLIDRFTFYTPYAVSEEAESRFMSAFRERSAG